MFDTNELCVIRIAVISLPSVAKSVNVWMYSCVASHVNMYSLDRPARFIWTPCDLLGLYQWETLHLHAGRLAA